MKTYKSEISWILAAPLTLFLIGSLIMTIVDQKWPATFIMLATCAFVLHLYTAITYQITATDLIINTGILGKSTIPISSIKAIKPTSSLISSPALSFDRIEVSYGKYDSAIISPKDRSLFPSDLKEINPRIELLITT